MSIGLAIATPGYAQAPSASYKHAFAYLAPKDYAFVLVAERWQREAEFVCLARLWGKESAWNHMAQNPKSTAFGIPQFLKRTWQTYGYDTPPLSPHLQIEAGLRYIAKRYKTPCGAWKAWQRKGWY